MTSFFEVADPKSELKVTEALTLGLWVKVASFDRPYQNLASDHAPNETSDGAGKILRLAGPDLQFIVGGIYGHGTGIFAHKQLSVNDAGTWLYVVGTYDRQNVRLFINGELVDSKAASGPIAKNPNPMLVGKSGYAEFLGGSVDDLVFYDRALSAEEIGAEYRRQRCSG